MIRKKNLSAGEIKPFFFRGEKWSSRLSTLKCYSGFQMNEKLVCIVMRLQRYLGRMVTGSWRRRRVGRYIKPGRVRPVRLWGLPFRGSGCHNIPLFIFPAIYFSKSLVIQEAVTTTGCASS